MLLRKRALALPVLEAGAAVAAAAAEAAAATVAATVAAAPIKFRPGNVAVFGAAHSRHDGIVHHRPLLSAEKEGQKGQHQDQQELQLQRRVIPAAGAGAGEGADDATLLCAALRRNVEASKVACCAAAGGAHTVLAPGAAVAHTTGLLVVLAQLQKHLSLIDEADGAGEREVLLRAAEKEQARAAARRGGGGDNMAAAAAAAAVRQLPPGAAAAAAAATAAAGASAAEAAAAAAPMIDPRDAGDVAWLAALLAALLDATMCQHCPAAHVELLPPAQQDCLLAGLKLLSYVLTAGGASLLPPLSPPGDGAAKAGGGSGSGSGSGSGAQATATATAQAVALLPLLEPQLLGRLVCVALDVHTEPEIHVWAGNVLSAIQERVGLAELELALPSHSSSVIPPPCGLAELDLVVGGGEGVRHDKDQDQDQDQDKEALWAAAASALEAASQGSAERAAAALSLLRQVDGGTFLSQRDLEMAGRGLVAATLGLGWGAARHLMSLPPGVKESVALRARLAGALSPAGRTAAVACALAVGSHYMAEKDFPLWEKYGLSVNVNTGSSSSSTSTSTSSSSNNNSVDIGTLVGFGSVQCALELGALAAGLRVAPFAFLPFVCATFFDWGMDSP
jgi:hypothetical protein